MRPNYLRRARRAALLVLLAGCSFGAQHATLQFDGYELSGGPYGFWFTVDLELLREWGGEQSATFKRRLELELHYHGLCPESYRLYRPGAEGERAYVLSGGCRSFAY